MPDITMCKDDRCIFKVDCYRFSAMPDNLYQSYFSKSPLDVKKGTCDHYMFNRSKIVDMPVENRAVEFADKLIELIIKYEIGNATFEKAKVIIEKKNIWAEVSKKQSRAMMKKARMDTHASGSACQLSQTKRNPSVTLSLDDGCTS